MPLTNLSDPTGSQQAFILEHLSDSSRILSGFSIYHTSMTVTITHYSNYAMYYNQLKIFQKCSHILQEIKLDIARPYRK